MRSLAYSTSLRISYENRLSFTVSHASRYRPVSTGARATMLFSSMKTLFSRFAASSIRPAKFFNCFLVSFVCSIPIEIAISQPPFQPCGLTQRGAHIRGSCYDCDIPIHTIVDDDLSFFDILIGFDMRLHIAH